MKEVLSVFASNLNENSMCSVENSKRQASFMTDSFTRNPNENILQLLQIGCARSAVSFR